MAIKNNNYCHVASNILLFQMITYLCRSLRYFITEMRILNRLTGRDVHQIIRAYTYYERGA